MAAWGGEAPGIITGMEKGTTPRPPARGLRARAAISPAAPLWAAHAHEGPRRTPTLGLAIHTYIWQIWLLSMLDHSSESRPERPRPGLAREPPPGPAAWLAAANPTHKGLVAREVAAALE
jgi:hypothetical protein